MKKSIIKEMFWGNKGTYEEIPLSEEYTAAEKKMFEVTDAFLEKLNQEETKMFDTVYEHMMFKSAEYAADHFIEGFKLGLSVGLEAAKDNTDCRH